MLFVRTFVLFLAIFFTGLAVSLLVMFHAAVSIMDPEKNANIFGEFKVQFDKMWVFVVVALLWAAFFFLGQL